MFAKLVVLCAVVAIAYGGVVVSPAATTYIANHHVVAGPALTYAAAPLTHVAAVRTAPAVIAAQPTIIQTGQKIVQTVEPVEQHGYSIAY